MSNRDKLILKAPAKINLFLKVLGRRPDGYHDIYSLLQAVSLYDTLTFAGVSSGFELRSDSCEVATDRSNLVWRAYDLIKERYNLQAGVRIELKKEIPVGAGLGGGSSDAASTLKGLNRLFELGIDKKQLRDLGAMLGSDVPFFFSSGSALISGRGEFVESVEIEDDYFAALIVPSFRIETRWAYSGLRIPLTSRRERPNFLKERRGAAFFKSLNDIGNDFAELVAGAHPEIGRWVNCLRAAGARHIAISGSGSAFFGLFDKQRAFESSELVSEHSDWRVFNVDPVSLL